MGLAIVKTIQAEKLSPMCGYVDEATDHVPGDEEHAEKKSGVADPVDDESFVGGVAGRLAMEIEADEQVGAPGLRLPSQRTSERSCWRGRA